jgi:hypothetical protein
VVRAGALRLGCWPGGDVSRFVVCGGGEVLTSSNLCASNSSHAFMNWVSKIWETGSRGGILLGSLDDEKRCGGLGTGVEK